MKLRLGFASVHRPLFKGDSHTAIQRSRQHLERLGEREGFEVRVPSLTVTDMESSQQAAQELQESSLDFLLIQHTTFATGDLLVPLLHAHRRVGLWALPESAGGSPQDKGPLPLNSLCGLNMALSSLDHPQVQKREPVKWFYGEADSEWFQVRLQCTLQALRGLRALAGARILHLGGTAPAFYDIEERPELESVTVEDMELAEVLRRVREVADVRANQLVQEWLRTEPRLEAPGEDLVKTARIEIVLKELCREGDYDAIALRCWPEFPDTCRVMVCATVARMADADLPTACEGDVMGALSMLALQGLTGAPSILMDLSDFDQANDSLLFWHCGNGPLCWAASETRLTTHFNRDTLGVVRDMVLKPGAAIGFRFLDRGKKALIFSGEFVGPTRSSFDGVRGWFRKIRWNREPVSSRVFLSNVLDHQLPHHFAFARDERSESLNELCAWLGAEPLPLQDSRDYL